MATSRPRARILLEAMQFRGRHGVRPEERRLGGPFRVDLALRVASPLRYRDRLADTVDYRRAYACTRALLEGRPYRTLEALADALALALLRLPRVEGVTVRVTKLSPPLTPGATSAVELSRDK